MRAENELSVGSVVYLFVDPGEVGESQLPRSRRSRRGKKKKMKERLTILRPPPWGSLSNASPITTDDDPYQSEHLQLPSKSQHRGYQMKSKLESDSNDSCTLGEYQRRGLDLHHDGGNGRGWRRGEEARRYNSRWKKRI